jgi:hypothetical protein
VRRKGWSDALPYVEVIGVKNGYLWLSDPTEPDSPPYSDDCDDLWIKVEPKIPIPHRYIGLYAYGQTTNDVMGRCDFGSLPVVDVLHIWTDEDGVDRIERVKP